VAPEIVERAKDITRVITLAEARNFSPVYCKTETISHGCAKAK